MSVFILIPSSFLFSELLVPIFISGILILTFGGSTLTSGDSTLILGDSTLTSGDSTLILGASIFKSIFELYSGIPGFSIFF